MKKIISVVLLCMAVLVAQPAVYYVSSSGDDSNAGTSQGSPWRTLAKVNSFSFLPGDQILFNRGNIFNGSLTVISSGTAGNQIVFGAYGTGNNPVISGFTNVDTWSSLGGNIWESNSAVSTLSTCNMVTVAGVNTPRGRYPNGDAANGGYLTFQSHSGNTSITSSSLSGTPDWTGAEVVVRPVRWILDRRTITSQSGGTLNFAALSYTPLDGFGFFIQNDVRTLDAPGEWFYDVSTKKLKIYSTSQPVNVSVAAVADLLTLNASYVTIENLTLQGANDHAITGNSVLRNGLIIRNCTLTLCGGSLLNGITCDNFLISGNTLSNSNNNGLTTGTGDHCSVINNTIENIGLYPGMGQLIYHAISTGENEDILIKNNTIRNIGYVGISFYGNNIRVINNYIDGFCKTLDDGGGIYTYTGARAAMLNDTIKGNIVLNGVGAIAGTSGNQTSTAIAIYLDNNSKNIEVSYNTAAGTNTYGMLMNNSSYINIHHNTFFNNTPQIRSSFMTGSNPVTNNTISDNILVSKTATQPMIYLISSEENLASFGTINNNWYARPLDIAGTMFITSQPSALYANRTYSGWKTYTGHDSGSTLSAKTLTSESDICFLYNETAASKQVTSTFPGIDAKGTRYPTTFSLAPYSSVVIFKDLTNPGGSLKPIGLGNGKILGDSNGNPLGI